MEDISKSIIPDVTLDRMREDYFNIWKQNIVKVQLIRESNPQSGDYFHDSEEEVLVRKDIFLNIQGISSEAYKRVDEGIIEPDETLHAFAKWDEDIENLDIIKVGKYLYRIVNYNKSLYSGQFVFKEFDLKKIDSENPPVIGKC